MFTGLIEGVGRVADVKPAPAGMRLRVHTPLSGELSPGDSLAVNGVCLTVTVAERGEVQADIGPETARVTTLGSLQPGQAVNLERPLRGDGRFGGHFVQGHVDRTGRVLDVREDGDAHWLTIGFDEAAAPLLVPKGSIAVDGVSLTVATLRDEAFDVMLIPFTWAGTNLAERRPGDRVNLEFDIVGKYVARALEARLKPAPTGDQR
jgi:riboflavin synthase alpha subunit